MKVLRAVPLVPVLLFVAVTVAPAQTGDLSTPSVEMGKTVVTATRTEVSLKDAPGAVTVITAEEIKELPARDILEIVREKAGISLIGRGVGGRKTVSIRGLDNRHVLTLIDGKRIAASNAVMGHSDFENTWTSLENIERIEIVRGPLSALYGSEAIGGVINIITRPVAEDWKGNVKIGGGVRDDGNGGQNQSYGASANGPLVKDLLGLSVSADYIRDEDTPEKDDPNKSEIEGREIRSFGSKLSFTPHADHRFELSANFVDEDRWRDTSSRGKAYYGEYELEKYMLGLNWQGDLGPTQSKLNLYRSKIDKLSIKTYADGKRTEAPDVVTNDTADGQTSFSILGNLITLGGEYRKEKLEAASMASGEDDAIHGAVFIQDEMELFDRLLLTPGIRIDDHEFFGTEASPRIYALYRLTDRINLKGGYGHAFNAPTLKQVSPGYHASTGPHQFFGNPDLEPETSENYEAGIEFFGSRVTAKAFYFYNDIDDLIDWEEIGREGRSRLFKARNINSARTEGVETELSVELPYGFDLFASYTYLDAEDTENNKRLEERPRHTINARLKYSFPDMGLSTVLRYQHIGDQVMENDDDELESVPSYSLWHFGVMKRLSDKFDLQFGVENIGDVCLADESELYFHEERGRFYYVNLRASF